VTRADQSVVEVSGPQVFGDTLVGYVAGEFQELPTATVKRVVIRRPARARTIALIAASTAGAAVIAVFLAGVGDPNPRDEVDCDYEPEDPRCQ
jgi:hypothetical protein